MNFEEHARSALNNFAGKDESRRYSLVEAVGDAGIGRVLDLGCGAGQELLPFLERTDACGIGIDIAPELGRVAAEVHGDRDRIFFVRSSGSELPFADDSFDVVICRVALPYMNNRGAFAEVARVLKPNGLFLLKTHAPRFYLRMLADRAKTLNPKMIAYPMICLAASLWHSVTGRQLEKGIWRGKEIFQTERFVEREAERNNLKIDGRLPDDNPLTPSYRIMKSAAGAFFLMQYLSEGLAKL